jgi:uncharacterized protein with beta-barrel porin domain
VNRFTLPALIDTSKAGAGGMRRLRNILLGSVAGAALCLPGGEANAACVAGPADTLTCTANNAAGISSVGGAIEILLVNALTANITPAINVDGIDFSNALSITMTSTTGAFGITTTGTGIGIDLLSSAGSVTANHTGNITSAGVGIEATAFTTLGLTYSGTIASVGTAIDADSVDAMTIVKSGTITSTAGFGIDAATSGAAADLTITNGGATTGASGAIRAQTTDGNIIVNNTGVLTSSGGHGISAIANAANNNVTISSSANISASGANSGIRAQTTATGDIGITISGGTVIGGSTGAGISFVGGDANTLGNAGTIGATNNMAILGTTGNETITNNATGIIIGDIDLGAGVNAITNVAGGQIRSGTIVDLGGGTLTNQGSLRPAGVGTIGATNIVGTLTQTAAGSLDIDLNTATGTNDSIGVSIDANLDGVVTPNLIDRSLTVKQFTILSAANALNDNTLTVADTTAYNYTLAFNGNDLVLSVQLLAISPLIASPITPNQSATVAYLDRILDNGPSAAMILFLDTIGGLPTEAQLVAALDRLGPATYAGAAGGAVQSSQVFVNSLMSCPTATEPGNLYREGQCYWAQLKGRTTHYDTTDDNVGGREDATGVTGGLQGYIAPNWTLGGAMAYEHASTDTNNLASSEGDSLTGGLVAKGLYGNTTLAGSIFAGVGWFDTDRFVTPAVHASGEHDIGFAGAGLRLSHVMDQGSWYAKPIVDVGATYVSYGDIQETGAGVANLLVDGENEWVVNVGAALELGSRVMIQPGLMARPYVRFGVIAMSESEFSLTSRFAGAPAAAGTFTVTTGYDDVLADIGAGLDVFANAAGLSVNLNYDGKLGDNTSSHAAGVKLRMEF